MKEQLKYQASRIFRYVWARIEYLLEPFNPIVDNLDAIEKLGTQRYHPQYLFYIITPLYVAIDSDIVYFTIGYDIKNPYLYQHVVFGFMPENLRSQGDLQYLLAFPLCVIFHYVLFCGKYSHVDHILYPIPHNSSKYRSIFDPKMNQKLVTLLKKLWNNAKGKLEIINKIFEIEINMATTYTMVIYELYRIFFIQEYKTKFRIWFVAFLSMIFVHQLALAVLIGFYFIIINLFINIKQKYI